jgi:hypothetical protein
VPASAEAGLECPACKGKFTPEKIHKCEALPKAEPARDEAKELSEMASTLNLIAGIVIGSALAKQSASPALSASPGYRQTLSTRSGHPAAKLSGH